MPGARRKFTSQRSVRSPTVRPHLQMLDHRPTPPVRAPHAGVRWFPARHPLLVMLLAAALVRVVLILQGGQFYFPDETRYGRGALIYLGLLGNQPDQVRLMFSSPEHAGFTVLTALLVPVQHLFAQLTAHDNWSNTANFYASAHIAALLLGGFSVVTLWLIHRLALAAGASSREALFAALIAACTATLFYYARHLSPYDCSLALALAALIFAIDRTRPPRPLLAGACTAGCYVIYNGYWFMVPVIGFALLLSPAPSIHEKLIRLLRWCAGGLLVGALSMLPGTLAAGREFWTSMGRFAQLNAEGFPAEGWSLPWAYLWHTENVFGAAILIAIAVALLLDAPRRAAPSRVLLWLVLLAATYVCLLVVSTVTGKFAIYGRTIRPLVPFLCLLGGYALNRLTERRPGWARAAVAIVCLGAIVNFLPHLQQIFPGDLRGRVEREIGVPKYALSFSGPMSMFLGAPVTRPDLALVNATQLFPLREYVGDPAGAVLWETAHPLALKCYQFEGNLPRDRELFQRHGARMKLIRLADPAAVPAYPPPWMTTTPSYLSTGR